MHILFIPSWYATERNPVLGSFFREQALAVSRQGVKTGVIYAEFIDLYGANISEIVSRRFQIESAHDEKVQTLRVKGWLIPKLQKLSRRLWIQQTLRLFNAYVEKHGEPDLIHAQCVHQAGLAALEIKKRHLIPFVITEHFSGYTRDLFEGYQLDQARRVFSVADQVMSVSNMLADTIRPYVNGKKIQVIPNLVDGDFFSLPETSRNQESFVFLFVGFLTANKRVDLLLRAFDGVVRGVLQNAVTVKLVIAGEGNQRNALERLAAELGLTNRVTFTGALSRREVRNVMWQAKAFVSASETETFGVTFIEAMSTGLPVIATDSGGPRDFLDDSVGRLTPANDQMKLEEAMLEVFQQKEVWAVAETSIRDHVLDKFDEVVVARKMIHTYTAVLNKNTRTRTRNRTNNRTKSDLYA